MDDDRSGPIKAYRNETFINSPEARELRILAEYVEPAARFETTSATPSSFSVRRGRCPATRRISVSRQPAITAATSHGPSAT